LPATAAIDNETLDHLLSVVDDTPNVRKSAGMASLGGRKTVGKCAASRRLAALLLALAALLALFGGNGTPAQAQTPVDLQLVLAVDVSGSVNQTRFELQRDGYVAAFRSIRVLDTIRSGPHQAIAVTMVQWTGPALQVHVVPWMRIADSASAEAFAIAVGQAPRQLFGGGTSISGAIDYAVTLLAESPFGASRRVIDVSGDGSNNRGRWVNLARDEAVAAGIRINGLPILSLEPDLDRYYEQNVIGGPGAFVIAARDYEAFADAILKKLITEIAEVGERGRNASIPNDLRWVQLRR
jgi:Protein of unknown function (DUF1194)